MVTKYIYCDSERFIKTNFKTQKIEVTLHSLFKLKARKNLDVFSF